MNKFIYLDEIGKEIYEDKICGEYASNSYVEADIYRNEWDSCNCYAIHIQNKSTHEFERFGVKETIPYYVDVTIYKVDRHIHYLQYNLNTDDKVIFDSEQYEKAINFSWTRNKYIVIEPLKEHLQLMESEWHAFEGISGAVRHALRKLNNYWVNVK